MYCEPSFARSRHRDERCGLFATENGLRTLQRVVTITRTLAYAGENTSKIADILDEMDNLVTLLMFEAEDKREFERSLRHLGVKYTEFVGLADEFAAEGTLLTAGSAGASRTTLDK